MTGFRFGALWVAFLGLGQATANADTGAADTVTFHNGDRLSGHLKMATSNSVTFTGLVTGNVSLNWKDIQQLSLASGAMSIVNSQHPDGALVTAPVIEVVGTELHVKSAPPDVSSFALQDLVSVSPPAAPSARYFKAVGGALKISPESIVRATQKQISLAGAFDLGLVTTSEDAFQHQQTNLDMEANYSDSRKPGGAAVISELYSGIFQQNFYLRHANKKAKFSTDGPYLYGIANYYHNLSLGMNVAQSYGAGIGWDGGRGQSSYSLAADFRYLNEGLYAPGKSLSGPEAGLTEQYSYTFMKSGISLFQRVTFLPVLNNWNAYLVRGTAGIDVPVNSSLSLDFSILDDYLENAPPKNLQNYAKYTFSLKYTIGAPPAPH